SFLREGHQIVRHTATVDVAVGGDSPFEDLRRLRILPLPLRRNPASTTADFSEADVAVRRITDPEHPVDYRLVRALAAREEFALDSTAAVLMFGAPQTMADRLEVVHWTVAFRNDIVSIRYSGVLTLEVWVGDAAQAAAVIRS